METSFKPRLSRKAFTSGLWLDCRTFPRQWPRWTWMVKWSRRLGRPRKFKTFKKLRWSRESRRNHAVDQPRMPKVGCCGESQPSPRHRRLSWKFQCRHFRKIVQGNLQGWMQYPYGQSQVQYHTRRESPKPIKRTNNHPPFFRS